MAEKVTKLRVFVASPGDVSEERNRLKEVIDELNHGIAENKGLTLQYVGWDTHTWPGIGEDAQDVINREIEPYDIFIGIMWKRFGTPTKRAESGTEEEFEKAYSLWSEYGRPHIMLYFNNTPFFPSSKKETQQLDKVLDFKKKAIDKGALYWEYRGPKKFEKLVRKHLTKEILARENCVNKIPPPSIAKLDFQFYQALYNELDMYLTQFEQLQRDYNRELKGEQLEFAVDFSEIHDYMYPYRPESPRSNLNQYVFNTIENPLTLMPGAVGQLFTDLERALPSPDILDRDPMTIYEDVAIFINNFPGAIKDEKKIIKLYCQAESHLKEAWGELFKVVMQGEHHTAFHAVKSLIDQGKISPIKGIKKITKFPLDILKRAQWVRNHLNFERPGRILNNQSDTIDFAITWLLNTQKHGKRKRYLSIYTQSKHFIYVCTSSHQLRWEDDYLVRGAYYLKFRTRLQELFTSKEKRKDFVVEWSEKCRKLQREMTNLGELEKEPSKMSNATMVLLDLYRQFDEECRIPLTFEGEFKESEKSDVRERASKLYKLLKEKGEFRGRTGEAFEVLKKYLQDLQSQFTSFSPERVQAQDAKTYMENLAKWIESEKLEGS